MSISHSAIHTQTHKPTHVYIYIHINRYTASRSYSSASSSYSQTRQRSVKGKVAGLPCWVNPYTHRHLYMYTYIDIAPPGRRAAPQAPITKSYNGKESRRYRLRTRPYTHTRLCMPKLTLTSHTNRDTASRLYSSASSS